MIDSKQKIRARLVGIQGETVDEGEIPNTPSDGTLRRPEGGRVRVFTLQHGEEIVSAGTTILIFKEEA